MRILSKLSVTPDEAQRLRKCKTPVPHRPMAPSEKYFNRWSDRRFSNVRTAIDEWEVYRGVYRIGVEVDFLWIVKDGKTRSGKSRLHLVWQGRTNQDISIVSWKETVNPML